MLVNFLICGARKAGTTTLDTWCRSHPEICMAREKEPHFFDDDVLFAEGEPDYAVYHRGFDPGKGHRLFGEATPVYMYWPGAPERISRYNPQMKLLVLLRNPIERAWSYVDRGQYLFQLRRLWDLFGRDQVLVMNCDTLRQQPRAVLETVSGFLDIGSFPERDAISLNTQDYPNTMKQEDRDFIAALFEPEIRELEQVLDWDLSHWC